MAEATKTGAKVEPGSELADLAALLVTVNKISDALQSAAEERQSGATLADWLLLKTLDKEGPLSMAKTAAKIGVSRQRVHQQTGELESSGAISVAKGEDGKSRNLTLAAGGRALMKKLDDAFSALLSDDGALPTAPIHAARKSTHRIQKVLASKEPPRAAA
jgi:DNA-binding MarR family transcriptional regulator